MSRSRTTSRRDPLGPIETVVNAVLALFATFAVIAVVFTVLNLFVETHTSVGDGRTCAVVPDGAGGTYVGDLAQREPSPYGVEGILDFRADQGTYSAERFEVCLADPSAWQVAAGDVEGWVFLVGLLLPMLLLRQVIRHGRRDGLFAQTTFAEVRRLGRFLLAYALVAPLVVAAAGWLVLTTAVPGLSWMDALLKADLNWTLLLTAIGVVTMARVLERAVELQDDVDATV